MSSSRTDADIVLTRGGIGMHRHNRIGRAGLALAAPVAALGLLITPALAGAGVAQAKAASCSSRGSAKPPNPGSFDNRLLSITALSACDVWAVGSYSNTGIGQDLTLAEHWNGKSWKVLHTPSPGNVNILTGVSAVKSGNVWAVGHTDGHALILHWNGRKWARVNSPDPGSIADLFGVVAISATSVWAVGEAEPPTTHSRTLILHWNGKKWAHVTSPAPGDGSDLEAVTAASAGNVWAVGDYVSGTSDNTLILHWNGRKWTKHASPNPSGTVNTLELKGVSASSAGNAWAVGSYFTGSVQKTITMRWNGSAWKLVKNPSPGPNPSLTGVSAVSAGNAWAVGTYVTSTNQTLVMHWDGRKWNKKASPTPGNSSFLNGIAATSATNVWAAGVYFTNGTTPSHDLAVVLSS
jgi:hypothetical protein